RPPKPSSLLPAALHAGFEHAPDAAGPDAQRIHADPQPLGDLAAALDLLAAGVAIVIDDQLALLGLQLVEAAGGSLDAPLGQRHAIVDTSKARADRGRFASRLV